MGMMFLTIPMFEIYVTKSGIFIDYKLSTKSIRGVCLSTN